MTLLHLRLSPLGVHKDAGPEGHEVQLVAPEGKLEAITILKARVTGTQ
jgi:hypothetical protein